MESMGRSIQTWEAFRGHSAVMETRWLGPLIDHEKRWTWTAGKVSVQNDGAVDAPSVQEGIETSSEGSQYSNPACIVLLQSISWKEIDKVETPSPNDVFRNDQACFRSQTFMSSFTDLWPYLKLSSAAV